MKKFFELAIVAVFVMWGIEASAQSVAGVRSRLAVGANKVTIVEQSDAAATVKAVEQRPKRTKVNGYTVLILSDNSRTARENAEAGIDGAAVQGECSEGQGDLRGEFPRNKGRDVLREPLVLCDCGSLPHQGGGYNRVVAIPFGLPQGHHSEPRVGYQRVYN